MSWLGRSLDRTFESGRRREARDKIRGRSDWQRTCLERGRSCLALAEQAGSQSSRGFSYESLSLLRCACLWLLAYDAAPGQAPADLLTATPPPFLAPGEERWSALRAALRRVTFDDVTLGKREAEAERQELARLAAELFADREGPERERARAVGRASVRLLAVLSIATTLFLVGYVLIARASLGPDLAAGRPWKTSSTYAICDVKKGMCAGHATDIFFHTVEEMSPWIEYDLGSTKTVRRVEVRNRLDCCLERAVPLLVELSNDERGWVQVANRRDQFASWTATFPPTQARYVRLRVERKSMLHLEGVAIR